MGHLIWIASYPRSGNGWVRALLQNYLAPAGAPVFGPADDDAALSVAADPGFLEASVEDALATRGAVQRRLSHDASGPLLISTHQADAALGALPMIDRAATARAIYLVRDPRDVFASLIAQRGLDADQGLALFEDEGWIDDRRPGAGASLIGAWPGHVASWLSPPQDFPMMALRYEGLHRDTAGVLREILSFLDLPIDEARLIQAVEASGFERMRAQGIVQSGGAEAPVLRRGRAGGWAEELDWSVIARIMALCGPVAEQIGYR